jgi:hypothetical protein
MSTQPALQTAPVDSLAYAQSLYDYADQRLDAFSLRCWIIQRLMLDEGLEHLCAEKVFEHVLNWALQDDRAREDSRLQRRRRRESFRHVRVNAYASARRRGHPRAQFSTARVEIPQDARGQGGSHVQRRA